MNKNKNMDIEEIDLLEILRYLIHKLWIIILGAIICAGVGFAVSKLLLTPLYESTTRIYVLNKQNSDTISYSDTQLATQLTKDYEKLVTSRTVLEEVISKYSLSDTYAQFAERVSVENVKDTRIIAISVKDPSPSMAQKLADAVRDGASAHIKSVMEIQAVNVVDKANLPVNPVSPSVFKWTAMGGILGALLCIIIIVIVFLLDDTIKTSDDIEKYLGLSTLAVIPLADSSGEKKRSSKKSKKNK